MIGVSISLIEYFRICSSKVWAEEGVVQAAAEEFSDTPRMLQIAEEICGPYVWKDYDLLVMPPSFPFGGMENPCLTFVTPTLLVCFHVLIRNYVSNIYEPIIFVFVLLTDFRPVINQALPSWLTKYRTAGQEIW